MHESLNTITLLTRTLYFVGVDKIVTNPKKVKFCHKLISITVGIVLVYVIMLDNIQMSFEIVLWNFNYCFHYIVIVINNIFFEEKTLIRIFESLKKVDRKLNIAKSNATIGFQISLLTTLVISLKLLQMFALIYGRDEKASSLHIILASQICIFAIEFECVWRIYLIQIIRYRLQYIWMALKKIYPIEWFKEPVISVLLPDVKLQEKKDSEILKLVDAYQALADTADDVSANFQLNFTTRLITTTLNLLILIYRFMADSSNVGDLASVLSSFSTGIVVAFILTLLPCAMAEDCEGKIKDIKTILVQQALRAGIGEKENTILHRFISLINVRPICFYLYGVYKIDATLIHDTFNVSVTYSILILQAMILS